MLIDYDPYSAEMHADPYPTYAQLREHAPLYRSDVYDFWALSRYDDVQAVSRDWQTYSYAAGNDIDGQGVLFGEEGNFLDADPPKHSDLRGVIQPFFKPKDLISKMEWTVRARTEEIVDGFVERGSADLVDELAWALPIATACALLGLPVEDEPLLAQSARTMSFREPGTAIIPERSARAHREIEEYLQAELSEARARPGDGLLSQVARAEIDGRPIPEMAALGICLLTFIASIETTASHLSNSFLLLGRHPEQRAALVDDPGGIPRAVEESLRYISPVQVFSRKTTRAVEHHGEAIPEGSRVFIIYASANRDGARFEDGDSFNIGRDPRRNLAFGEGIHHCIGAPLARLEGRIAIETVLSRIPDYELGEGIEHFPSHSMRAVLHLPVTFKPRLSGSSKI